MVMSTCIIYCIMVRSVPWEIQHSTLPPQNESASPPDPFILEHDALYLGVVTAKNLREKLSKQLKIDLDNNKPIHIFSAKGSGCALLLQPILFSKLSNTKLQSMVEAYKPHAGPCSIEIKRLEEYLTKSSLKGGYSVPLCFTVLQR
jgi:hypothetical protein